MVTGAESGIGKAVAIAFAREGADVVISYLDEHEDDEDTRKWVQDTGRTAVLVPGDLTDAAHCRAVIDRAVQEFGRVHILVSNAAFQATHLDLTEISDEEWDYTLATNLSAMFRLCKAAVPGYADMRAHPGRRAVALGPGQPRRGGGRVRGLPAGLARPRPRRWRKRRLPGLTSEFAAGHHGDVSKCDGREECPDRRDNRLAHYDQENYGTGRAAQQAEDGKD